MKRILLFAICAVVFGACSEQDIEPFGDRHEIYFYKFFMDEREPGTSKADSTDVTFFFAKPTDDHVMADVVVALAGRPLTKDLHFGLKVVDEMTTAKPDEYVLDDVYTFRAREIPEGDKLILDTIQIRMNRSARLNELPEGLRLTVEIVPTEELYVGQYERSRAVIHLTKDAVKPVWWTGEVTAGLLGNYPDEAFKLTKLFKQYLAENPTWDEEHYEWMKVEI